MAPFSVNYLKVWSFVGERGKKKKGKNGKRKGKEGKESSRTDA